jgi:hypothetical protein
MLARASEPPTRPEFLSTSNNVALSPEPMQPDKPTWRVGTAEVRQCGTCGTTETPKWRDGTTRWLCNACGLRKAKRVRCVHTQLARRVQRATSSCPDDRMRGPPRRRFALYRERPVPRGA